MRRLSCGWGSPASGPMAGPSSPLPRSSTRGSLASRARDTNSASAGASVNPTMRKLLGWTIARSAATAPRGSRRCACGWSCRPAHPRPALAQHVRNRTSPRSHSSPRSPGPRPSAKVFAASSTAAVRLLTTSADSAPIRRVSSACLPVAALSPLEVELEVRTAGDLRDAGGGVAGEGRGPSWWDHDAGRVDDRLQRWGRDFSSRRPSRAGRSSSFVRLRRGAGAAARSCFVQHRAQLAQQLRGRDERRAVDGRQPEHGPPRAGGARVGVAGARRHGQTIGVWCILAAEA